MCKVNIATLTQFLHFCSKQLKYCFSIPDQCGLCKVHTFTQLWWNLQRDPLTGSVQEFQKKKVLFCVMWQFNLPQWHIGLPWWHPSKMHLFWSCYHDTKSDLGTATLTHMKKSRDVKNCIFHQKYSCISLKIGYKCEVAI